jgi:hypothetical protein
MKKNFVVKLVETYKNFVLIDAKSSYLLGDVYLWEGKHIHYITDKLTADAINLILDTSQRSIDVATATPEHIAIFNDLLNERNKRAKIVASLKPVKNSNVWDNVPLFKKWRTKRVPTGAIVNYSKTEIQIIHWLYEDQPTLP